jgi:hypothetical protein
MNRGIITSLIIFSSGAVYALTPNQWQFRQAIEVPSSGLVRVSLPAETINIARPDLSDLRIIDAGEKEVPFLIDQPMPRAESTVPPKAFHAEIISAGTRLLITTGTDLIIAGITLETRPEQVSSNQCGWKDQMIKRIGERLPQAIRFSA